MDDKKMQEFMGKALGDMGGAVGSLLAFAGDRLGLFKAMAGAGPLTPEELAKKTGTHPRIITEWLASQAAGGYVIYDRSSDRYTLPEEQAAALTNENAPQYISGVYQILVALFKDEEKVIETFKSGKGLGWGDHHHYLFEGTERFFKPNYVANLISSWIPALDGVESKLKSGGAKVADVGCGHGASTLLMARAFPESRFTGFDFHPPSIEWARKQAEKDKVKNVTFEVSSATDFPGDDYDFVTFFDCLHDMSDPSGTLAHVLGTLKNKNGTCMIVEPFANDKIEDNMNSFGRLCYSISTMVCVPASLNYDGAALGAQAGEARMRQLATSAGFTRFRRAAQTPFNLIFEARP